MYDKMNVTKPMPKEKQASKPIGSPALSSNNKSGLSSSFMSAVYDRVQANAKGEEPPVDLKV